MIQHQQLTILLPDYTVNYISDAKHGIDYIKSTLNVGKPKIHKPFYICSSQHPYFSYLRLPAALQNISNTTIYYDGQGNSFMFPMPQLKKADTFYDTLFIDVSASLSLVGEVAKENIKYVIFDSEERNSPRYVLYNSYNIIILASKICIVYDISPSTILTKHLYPRLHNIPANEYDYSKEIKVNTKEPYHIARYDDKLFDLFSDNLRTRYDTTINKLATITNHSRKLVFTETLLFPKFVAASISLPSFPNSGVEYTTYNRMLNTIKDTKIKSFTNLDNANKHTSIYARLNLLYNNNKNKIKDFLSQRKIKISSIQPNISFSFFDKTLVPYSEISSYDPYYDERAVTNMNLSKFQIDKKIPTALLAHSVYYNSIAKYLLTNCPLDFNFLDYKEEDTDYISFVTKILSLQLFAMFFKEQHPSIFSSSLTYKKSIICLPEPINFSLVLISISDTVNTLINENDSMITNPLFDIKLQTPPPPYITCNTNSTAAIINCPNAIIFTASSPSSVLYHNFDKNMNLLLPDVEKIE